LVATGSPLARVQAILVSITSFRSDRHSAVRVL